MAQQLRVLSAPAEDPSLVLSTHIRWVTTSCNSSFRRSDASGLPGHLHSCAQTYIHITKNNKGLEK